MPDDKSPSSDARNELAYTPKERVTDIGGNVKKRKSESPTTATRQNTIGDIHEDSDDEDPATPTGEQAPVNTPEANSGTVSSTRVAQEQGNVNRVYKAKAPARIPSTDIGQHARCQESGMGRSQSGTKKSISPEKENVNGQRSQNRVGDIEGLSLRTSMDSITR